MHQQVEKVKADIFNHALRTNSKLGSHHQPQVGPREITYPPYLTGRMFLKIYPLSRKGQGNFVQVWIFFRTFFRFLSSF